MIVNNLETMEKIVNKNKSLSWDGWNVIELKTTELAKTSVNGVRVNNKWYIKKTFVLDRSGWHIPDKYKV